MIIHPPETSQNNGEICISSRIENNKPIENFPEKIWFSFPDSYEQYLTVCSEAFLLALLGPAMHFNEDIEVRGGISPKLLLNLKEFIYMSHLSFEVHNIQISATELKQFVPQGNPAGVIVSFSGGVDSMYTLMRQIPDRQPIIEGQITHGLLIHGFADFDIALHDSVYFNNVFSNYQKLFSQLDLPLLTGKTNAYQFSKFRVNWDVSHTPLQVAFAYLLGNLVNKFYVNSDGDQLRMKLYDKWLVSNHLLSNENIDVVSYTAIATRSEKIASLANWPLGHLNIRVCQAWDKTNVDLNCGKCWKCLSTMVLIDIVGVYDKFTSFPQPYTYSSLFKFFVKPRQNLSMEIILTAKKYRRYDFIFWFYLFRIPLKIKDWFLHLFDRFVSDEIKYKIRNRYFSDNGI